MIVCICRAVSDRQIRSAVDDGARSLAALRDELGCGSCCGKCTPRVRELVDEHASAKSARSPQVFACAA